jgi:peptidoglycan hydrolase CwlO-like protein
MKKTGLTLLFLSGFVYATESTTDFKNEQGEYAKFERIDRNVAKINDILKEMATMKAEIEQLKAQINDLSQKKSKE